RTDAVAGGHSVLLAEQFYPYPTDARRASAQYLLEQNGIIWKIFGQGIHALDYTESGDESRRQNLVRPVAPEVKTIEHPVEFLDAQTIASSVASGDVLNRSDSRRLSQRQKPCTPNVK